jgi:ParB-like chromosome segregation protein Spo0J
VDRDGKVLAGHGRFMACRQLGLAEVPVIRLGHLTYEQARAYAIADNRLTETFTWDEKILAGHFKVLAELDLDFRLEATGFTIGEIDLEIEGLDEVAPAPDPDDAPAPVGPAVAKLGDLWILVIRSALS